MQPDARELPVWYWKRANGGKNLGDFLGQFIPEQLSGKNCCFEPLHSGKQVHVCVGSVLQQKLHPACCVWGAGFVAKPAGFPKGMKIFAVGGPLSLQVLRTHDYEGPIAVGDPALLLPFLLAPQDPEPAFELGIIPHYVDQATLGDRCPELTMPQESMTLRACVLDIQTEDVRAFVGQLLKCRFIISSSLHGLILAHAYGIPAVWVQFSNSVIGGRFKFLDYFMSVSVPPYEPCNFRHGTIHLDNLIELQYRTDICQHIVNFNPIPLLDACPFISDRIHCILREKIHAFGRRETLKKE
jgi:pyruvyltransferase